MPLYLHSAPNVGIERHSKHINPRKSVGSNVAGPRALGPDMGCEWPGTRGSLANERFGPNRPVTLFTCTSARTHVAWHEQAMRYYCGLFVGTIQRVGHAAKCLERLRKWETSIQKTCESCVVLSTNMLSSSLAVSMQSAMQCHGGSFNVAHHDCTNREALYNVTLAVRACLWY
jgi:hypothetical protein